ncbi:MAG: hypothetical protein OXF11_05385 [Deltaproteobacteria bacterium]|nr:hypothetical protein [Deltaproteobacteria bacterium]
MWAAEKARATAEGARVAAAAARAAADDQREAADRRATEAEADRTAAEVARDTAKLRATEAAATAEVAEDRATAAEAAAERAQALRETAETALLTAEQLLMEANAALVVALRSWRIPIADSTLPLHQQIAMNAASAAAEATAISAPSSGELDQSTLEGRAVGQINEIAARSDRLLYTDTHLFDSGGDSLRMPSLCRQHVCSLGHNAALLANQRRVTSIDSLSEMNGIATFVRKETIPYGARTSPLGRTQDVGFGGWMNHSFFQTLAYRIDHEGHPAHGDTWTRAFVTGDAPYTNPNVDVNAVWRGAVLARDPSVVDNLESLVTGNARISVDLGGEKTLLDVRLSGLENASTGTRYLDFVYDDLPVSRGAFERRFAENDFLRGVFYGPNHEEVAGVFEHWQGLVGVYGARRQDE